ncbi:DUF2188 domain-containing protein [Paenibacillus pasadenensis]|uniref:DUF2188 domain-containing protein n=1 Tax=Paenibacillus pasadenensis TaxID=217090 RepID=UPI00203C51BA|nr:DUF2188 domain-containing protein [Paenibacillus pasadenensis]MCM3747663.1 DUF2188 domain-containing protein [Paenibacillus pasadenensis]
MPWSKNDYPPSMKNMDERARAKAVDIANALLRDGYEEGRAIAIATSQAEKWAQEHPGAEASSGPDSNEERYAHNKTGASGGIQHVVPHAGQWQVKDEGADDGKTFATKEKAVDYAKQAASDRGGTAIIHRADGTVETSRNYA